MQLKNTKAQHIIQAGSEERTVQFILKEVMFGFVYTVWYARMYTIHTVNVVHPST